MLGVGIGGRTEWVSEGIGAALPERRGMEIWRGSKPEVREEGRHAYWALERFWECILGMMVGVETVPAVEERGGGEGEGKEKLVEGKLFKALAHALGPDMCAVSHATKKRHRNGRSWIFTRCYTSVPYMTSPAYQQI